MAVNRFASTLMDPTLATARRGMVSTVMGGHAGYPVGVTTQPTMAASILLAGPHTTLSTSAVSGTSVQQTPPQTQSSLSPLILQVMEFMEEIHVQQTIFGFMMETLPVVDPWAPSVF